LIAFNRHKPGNLTCRRSLPHSTDWIRRLIEAAAGGPFGDDAKGSLESLYAQPPPEFGSIPAASRPERVERLGMQLKDTHAAAEILHSASSGDASDRLARKAKPFGNLFEWGSPFDQLRHRVDRLLAVLEILPPLALGTTEQCGVDAVSRRRFADGVHILAHDVKKARAGVFEEMPTISDLCSLGRSRGCGVGVARATISGNELDAGVTMQPGGTGATRTIRQERNDAAALKIADDGAVLASLAPCPVINSDCAQWLARARRAPANRSKQGILTDWDCQAVRQVMSGTPT
jgi:hypothetical protein